MTREDIEKAIVVKLDAIANNITGSSETGVSGVKGNMEENFRTGNVNLTPANIGAVPSQEYSSDMTEIDNAIRDINALYGASIALSIDTSSYILTISLLNKEGTTLSTKTVDLPIESMIVNATYSNGKIIMTLQSGQTLEVDVSDLVSGLVSENRKIAGIDLKDDITESEMRAALHVPAVLSDLTDGSRVTTAESNITSLTGRMATAESNITSQGTRLTTAEGNISRQSAQIAETNEAIKVDKNVVVDDSALIGCGSGVLNDLMLYGRSKQDGTPTPSAPSEIKTFDKVTTQSKNLLNCTLATSTKNGVTCEAISDGTFKLNGTASGTATFNVCGYDFKNGVQYNLVGCPSSGSSSKYRITIASGSSTIGVSVSEYGNGFVFTPTKDGTTQIAIQIIDGNTVSDLIFKPMLCNDTDSTYDSFVPYASIESAIPTLYGIPVPSGGNYVDKDGQNWISDILDLESGKITRCVKKCVFTIQATTNVSTKKRFKSETSDALTNGTYDNKGCMCSHVGVARASATGTYGCIEGISIDDKGAVLIYIEQCSAMSVDDFNAWCATNNLEAYYALATPTTETLPQSTINNLRQLRSFADKTHIYCDNGSLEAVVQENTEVGNAIGRNAIKINEILNLLNPVTSTLSDSEESE